MAYTDIAQVGLDVAAQVREAADNAAESNAQSNYSSNGRGGVTVSSSELMEAETRLNGPNNGNAVAVGTSVNDNATSDEEKAKEAGRDLFLRGRPSFFNPYYLIRYHSASKSGDGELDANQMRLDQLTNSGTYIGLADDAGYKNASTSYILKYLSSENQLERRLSYADFLYLKHYHPYNNNRLITLRRFMLPVYDNLRVAYTKDKANYTKLATPIAKALTYFGGDTGNELSSLTSFTYAINTKDVTGEVSTTEISEIDWTSSAIARTKDLLNFVGPQKPSSELKLSQIGGRFATGAASLLAYMADTRAYGEGVTGFNSWVSNYDPWKQGPLSDLVYGPVNVINSAKIRARGFTYKNSYVVKFQYSLKSIGGLNPKAAMLDILSNMLALTYNHANFWGGENRFLIDRKNFPFINQEIFHKFLANPNGEGMEDVIRELSNKATSAYQNIMEDVKASIKNGMTDDAHKKVVDLATTLALSGNQAARGMAKQLFDAQRGILTGAPTGEWHLQVGNPLAPIMMIGNLWCTSATFDFSNELGIDDFPTELTVSVTLEDGRPRDASDIQSIFNSGGGRIYYPYKAGEAFDPNNSYSTQNSETAFTLTPDQVKGANNRVSVDRSGMEYSDLLLKPNSRVQVNSNKDGGLANKRIFQRIMDNVSPPSKGDK